MAEPVADRHEVDAGLEKMDGGRVSQHVRVNAFGVEGRRRRPCAADVLAQEVADTETGQRLAAAVAEHGLRRGRIDSALREQRAEDLHGLRPEGTHALLAALAAEPGLEGAHELEVARPQVEDLLYAGARVEEREEERMISTAVGRRAGGSIEEGTDLVAFEILDEARACAFEGHGEDALTHLDVLGMIRGGVAREGVDGGEASVACRCAVVSVSLEVVEECEDVVNADVAEVESDDRALATPGNKSQKEHERIAVAEHGVRTHAADSRQVIGEEATQGTGERIGRGTHR